jgi:hypothetical protein
MLCHLLLLLLLHLQASDNPVKARFVPLGEFIKKVGPAPSDVAMVTYLQVRVSGLEGFRFQVIARGLGFSAGSQGFDMAMVTYLQVRAQGLDGFSGVFKSSGF